MEETINAYRTWLVASGCSPRTVSERLWGRGDLLRYAPGLDPHHVTSWVARAPAAWSRVTYYSHAAAYARYLTMTGGDGAWIDGVPRPRARRGTPRPVDPVEYGLAVTLADPRARTMLLLAGYAGLRVSEIATVRGRDVTGEALYVHGKGGVTAMIPLHPLLLAEAERHSAGWWFPGPDNRPLSRQGVWRAMTNALHAVGSTATPHQCRHLYATALLDSGANLRTVQELLRHASVATTQIYTRVTDEDRRAAIRRLPVLASAAS